jgi:hypothetical protein
MINIWPHKKEGFSWCVITDDVEDNAPKGWSPTVEDANRHAERAYVEWLDGREEHDETADIVADAVAQERAAVVAWLRECALDPETTGAEMRLLQEHANRIDRGEHRREETK